MFYGEPAALFMNCWPDHWCHSQTGFRSQHKASNCKLAANTSTLAKMQGLLKNKSDSLLLSDSASCAHLWNESPSCPKGSVWLWVWLLWFSDSWTEQVFLLWHPRHYVFILKSWGESLGTLLAVEVHTFAFLPSETWQLWLWITVAGLSGHQTVDQEYYVFKYIFPRSQ